MTNTSFKTIKVNGLDIFYREAGPKDAPTILLLHGFPSSSHMYRDLISDLSARYHLIAPDYPGFGYSSSPTPEQFTYTFDNLATVTEAFIDALGLKKFYVYMQDYGGPVGFRVAVKRPELIQGFIIQNANAYLDGLGEGVKQMAELQKKGGIDAAQPMIDEMLTFEGTKIQYTEGAKDQTKVSPDAYYSDYYFLERPGNKAIQSALLKNYRTNFDRYPEWQAYFRSHQPKALIVWGKNDPIFIAPGAKAYQRDLKNTELHLLDGSHFALEEYHSTIATLIDGFISRK